MRLKMAENSLFAILLRSQWWISLAVAIAFVAAARALLPAQYFIYGALGGFPFVVIAGMAMWRQVRAPSAGRVQAALEQARAMSARDFNAALTRAWRARGHHVEPFTGEGADLRITRDGRASVVATRRWKAAHHGVEPLRDLLAAREAAGVSGCVFVAQGELSEQARALVKAQGVEVLDAQAIGVLIA